MIPCLNFLEFAKVVKKLTKYAKIHFLMVSSILHITSHIEHTKEHNGIDSESKSVKQNTDHQNRLTVCSYMLL